MTTDCPIIDKPKPLITEVIEKQFVTIIVILAITYIIVNWFGVKK